MASEHGGTKYPVQLIQLENSDFFFMRRRGDCAVKWPAQYYLLASIQRQAHAAEM